jgi:hypothetical protein
MTHWTFLWGLQRCACHFLCRESSVKNLKDRFYVSSFLYPPRSCLVLCRHEGYHFCVSIISFKVSAGQSWVLFWVPICLRIVVLKCLHYRRVPQWRGRLVSFLRMLLWFLGSHEDVVVSTSDRSVSRFEWEYFHSGHSSWVCRWFHLLFCSVVGFCSLDFWWFRWLCTCLWS